MKKFWSAACALTLLAGLLAAPAEAAEPVTLIAGGWYETLCARLPGASDAEVAAVTYTDGTDTWELTEDDFTYLVRDTADGVRIDIPGVKAGSYALTVTLTSGQVYQAKNLPVSAYDRSGFAHRVHTTDETGAITGIEAYTEGVGAYNDDGTLKENAIVLYVTDENKDTVTANFSRNGDPKTIIGIGNILNSNNSKANQGLLEFISREGKPLVVRFVGTVNQPQGVSAFKQGSSNGGMVQMLSGANITLEGIGPDATIQGWGFSFGADHDDTQYNKSARNFEVRNLSFKNVPEDCVEITGYGNSDGSIKEPVEHTWVHNCSFYVPEYIENAAENDKHYGDGALDYKWGRYMTSSYNYFEGCKKTSLIGGDDDNQQYHVTWHHNWWTGCNSRSPLCRQADVHIYNNLYEGQTSYCMSLRANCFIFSEYNAFLNCADPVRNEGSGGVCKSYHDVFSNCTGANSATVVTDADKGQPLTSANLYANFDASETLSYIPAGDYALETDPAKAEADVRANAGAMTAFTVAEGALGDLTWAYDDQGRVTVSGEVPEGRTVWAAAYEDGRCVKVARVADGAAELGAGAARGKLFLLSADQAPQCAAAGWETAQ